MAFHTLAARLAGTRHQVTIARSADERAPAVAVLDELIANGIVPVIVHGPDGDTEIDLDIAAPPAPPAGGAPSAPRTRRLSGALVLDEEPVEVTIEIDIDTLRGWGELVRHPRAD